MRHEELGSLRGEVLIHCGDMFNLFERRPGDIEAMDTWFSQQRFDIILCIGGNHDHVLEDRRRIARRPFQNAIYLEDEAFAYNGTTFYGTPWVPLLQSHAYYAEDVRLKERWSKIPTATDVLITHTPPEGMLDRSSRGLKLGCAHLASRLSGIAPAVHCFGHVHASGGTRHRDATTYINASSVDRPQRPLRQPILVEVSTDRI